MTVQDGLLFLGTRVIVPLNQWAVLKEILHSFHLEMDGCCRRTRECIYWPNMNSDIRVYIAKSPTCCKYEVAKPWRAYNGSWNSRETLGKSWSGLFPIWGQRLFMYNGLPKQFLGDGSPSQYVHQDSDHQTEASFCKILYPRPNCHGQWVSISEPGVWWSCEKVVFYIHVH